MENGELPVLVKFIDAKKDLSVQVHPNDEYAERTQKVTMARPRCGMSLMPMRAHI